MGAVVPAAVKKRNIFLSAGFGEQGHGFQKRMHIPICHGIRWVEKHVGHIDIQQCQPLAEPHTRETGLFVRFKILFAKSGNPK